MKSSNKLLKYWLPVLLWAAIIFIFSSNQDPYRILPESWRHITPLGSVSDSSLDDLIAVLSHFLEYGILAFLLSRALYHNRTITWKIVFIVVILSMLYALSDETHQLFVPGRQFQLFDLFIDLLGSTTGSLLYKKST